jgi:transposase InsO family protein
MDEEATLKALFVKLGFPGLLKFRAAAKKINLEPPLKTLRRIVEGSSQRQVLLQEPEYRGKVVADALNSRWAADLISYVSQPTEDGFTHVLVVQDIFSRKIWTRALKSAQTGENTQAFLEILGEARAEAPDSDQPIPFELNTDKGSEFTGKVFQDMLLEKKIKFREKEALNDLATVDRAIQTLKKTLTKFEISPALGNWAEELQNATEAHNKNVHTHLQGGTPEDVAGDKEKQFELQGMAARDRDQQTKVTKKLERKLTANPTYRTVTTSALKGLKERSFKPRFEAGTQKLDRIEGRYAIDTQGKKSLVSRVLTVPANSTTIAYKDQTQQGDTRLITTRRAATIALRDRIAALMPPTGLSLQTITKKLTPEEKVLLRAQKLETREFLELHEIFGIANSKFHNKKNFNPVKIEIPEKNKLK